jgi:fibrillarin-like pre-rRNA processing protein
MESNKAVYNFGKDFCTLSIAPNKKVYDERVIRQKGMEFRIIDPFKSKFGAALKKGMRDVPIRKGMKILYLGISTGTTASHFSDMVGREGMIYGVEFSPRSVRDLMKVTKSRSNIAPIFGDARMPEDFAYLVENVDLIYADVAQPDQSEIMMRNAAVFLKQNGIMMIAIKARSIDVSKNPRDVFASERKKLESMFDIKEQIDLDPYEKDHAFFVGRKK